MAGKRRQDYYDPEQRNTIHAWNKFARGLYMLGEDERTQEQHSHRLPWMQRLQATLARQFAIEIRTTAIMENHLHLVLENRPDVVRAWTDREVVRRWLTITKLKIGGTSVEVAPRVERLQQELDKGPEHLQRLRKRLADFSWFMGSLSESISRRINREEEREGTCWQGRFKCRVAEDDEDVLKMMLYVDLNPLRAQLAERVEDSDRSGAGLRLRAILARQAGSGYRACDFRAAEWLSALYLDERRGLDDPMYFRSATGQRVSDRGIFWFADTDYFRLLDFAAHESRPDKRGATPPEVPPILDRLGVSALELTERLARYAQRIR